MSNTASDQPVGQKRAAPDNGLVIAVVGCDGSGKSTIADALLEHLRQFGPAQACHLGVQSGQIGRRIAALPLVGPLLDRKIEKKSSQARDKGAKIPDALTALVIYLFTLRRVRRFKRMLALRRQGITVVTDRYPQTAVHGFFDGPGLSVAKARGGFVTWLARRELALFDRMIQYRPDLVIRLNVDTDTAMARKPDHRLASIKAKVAATPLLEFQGAPIVDLSSLDPLPQVIAAACAAVDQLRLKQRQP